MTNSRLIKASPEKIYHALTDPVALASWRAPGNMHGLVHHFEGKEGGGYTMSLFYPEDQAIGKTTPHEDRFTSRFIQLSPYHTVIEAIRFDTTDLLFEGEMFMEIRLAPVAEGTIVSFHYSNLPKGISPDDNNAGTSSSLEKLAKYVE